MADKDKKLTNLESLIRDADAIKAASVAQAKTMLAEALAPDIKRIMTKNIQETEDSIGSDESQVKGKVEGEPLNQDLPDSSDTSTDQPVNEEEDLVAEDDEFDFESEDDMGSDDEMPEVEEGIDDLEGLSDEEGEEDTSLDEPAEMPEDDVYPDLGDEGEPEDEEVTEVVDAISEALQRSKKKKLGSVVEVTALRNQNSKLKSALRESMIKNAKYEKLARILHGKLNETALLNAKLTYSYDILTNNALTRNQKIMVVERLDDASTVIEAKKIYKTLKESFKSTSVGTKSAKSVIKESIESNRTLISGKKTQETKTIRDSLITENLVKRWNDLTFKKDEEK